MPAKTTLVKRLSWLEVRSHSDLTAGPTKERSIISIASEIQPKPA
uniref:Uncharacterized protein n=1 Tax=Rhizophora mucronata TaxID=61149 RepID=A0A2P2MJ61_RHIMU